MGSIYADAAKARISEMSNAVGLNTTIFGGLWVRHATVPPLGAPLMNVFPGPRITKVSRKRPARIPATRHPSLGIINHPLEGVTAPIQYSK